MAEDRSSRPVRVRIAPSPTGDPHVGTAYIALFNYAFARNRGGAFILRIEDTDQTRYRADSERAILAALRWLGLDWDEGPDVGGPHGPYRQSERKSIHREHAELLVAAGTAYRCFCTAERLEELRQRQRAEKRNPGYDRHCRRLDPAEGTARAAAGEPYTIRLAVPEVGVTRFRDELRGEVEFDNGQIDDQVLIKSDGFPTYHLANVVDDRLMKVSHVIRGEEWMSSTPKHVILYRAFGWEPPDWYHMPLLRNPDKSKLSKRRNPVSIDHYRDIGILPQALLNFLGIMGWSFGGDREKFTLTEMVQNFGWERLSLGGPTFDREKLRWMNEQYLHAMSGDELADALLDWRLGKPMLRRVAPLVRERIKQLDEFIPATDYFFSGELEYGPVAGELAIPEVAAAEVATALIDLIALYEEAPAWEHTALEQVSRAFCESRGWKAKHVFMLLRLLVTARKASPPLFETMEVLGKEITRRRLRAGADLLGQKT